MGFGRGVVEIGVSVKMKVEFRAESLLGGELDFVT